jgi:NAD(P)H dehydrogenase (quinone)
MKLAVTAANGKLGSTISNRLIAEIGPENVIGIARTPQKAEFLGIEIRKGDYNSLEDFVTALNGIDALLIVSGMDEPSKRIQQHRNIISGAKANAVKKVVYTSIIGDEIETAFSPIVQSNRQTEEDVRNSGLDWVIGRNGLYIEPDLEYIDNYIAKGEIHNSAGNGKCAYTSRKELADAYLKMLIEDKHNGQIYNLGGEPVSQKQLTEYLNEVYNTNLIYKSVSVKEYTQERKNELGEFMGMVIGGIYEGIKKGAFNVESDFYNAAGRQHKSLIEIISNYKKQVQ